jgi:hypothetical protein
VTYVRDLDTGVTSLVMVGPSGERLDCWGFGQSHASVRMAASSRSRPTSVSPACPCCACAIGMRTAAGHPTPSRRPHAEHVDTSRSAAPGLRDEIGRSVAPGFSDNGQLAYPSTAPNLVAGDTDAFADVFVHDIAAISCSASSGGGTTTTQGVIAWDTTPPSIAIAQPPAQSYAQRQTVTIAFTCNDATSGIASCTANQPGTLDTSTPGTLSLAATAVDHAGNVSPSSVMALMGLGNSTGRSQVSCPLDVGIGWGLFQDCFSIAPW